jgi:Zn-dependent metalloprotease
MTKFIILFSVALFAGIFFRYQTAVAPEPSLNEQTQPSQNTTSSKTDPLVESKNKPSVPLLKTINAGAHLLSTEQTLQMETLMIKNGISLSGLQAYSLTKDSLGQTHIRFYVYVNGLKAEDTIYHFKSDETFSRISNPVDTKEYSSIPTIPSITGAMAIQIAKTKISGETEAKLEFWNKNIGRPDPKDIILAWRVDPIGEPKYPYVIIDAQSVKIVYFDDGVRY